MLFQTSTVVKILTDITGLIPGAGEIHSLLVEHAGEATALIPVLRNLGEVPSALAAAEQHAPNLTAAIKDFAAVVVAKQTNNAVNNDDPQVMKTAENMVRSLGGLGRMTADQEKAWMDRSSPLSEDSRSGSG